jgi:hypothetical protein
MKILNTIQIIVFYIKTDLPIPKNDRKIRDGTNIFFFFTFTNFFHFGDVNLESEHEINIFFFH